ncbi:hypothetical protein Hsc_1322 [Herbaspirillum seropedicae]|nr:hypothetical protein Hsc_1322 [Herbaspirillum seropedicae]
MAFATGERLWSGLYLGHGPVPDTAHACRPEPSSLYTFRFPSISETGLARYCQQPRSRRDRALSGFTEFDSIHAAPFGSRCPIVFRRGSLYPLSYGGSKAAIVAAASRLAKLQAGARLGLQ